MSENCGGCSDNILGDEIGPNKCGRGQESSTRSKARSIRTITKLLLKGAQNCTYSHVLTTSFVSIADSFPTKFY